MSMGMNDIRPPFPRTTCACPADVANCKQRPGMLMPSDIEPITRKLLEPQSAGA
jgi:hypothetical protein